MIGQGRPAQPAAPVGARFERPIFIVSSPRAGSSLLFQTMAQAPEIFTIGGESHILIETIPGLHPRERGWSSNCLEATDAIPPVVDELAGRLHAALRDRNGRAPAGRAMMIEKTPKNSLRIPFLAAVFPDARFVYLYRDPRETMSSMIEAWLSGRFITYPALPGWPNLPWSLLLVPGWRKLAALSLPEIVAHQWAETTDILLDDLATMPDERVRAISYADFIASPQAVVAELCASLDIAWDRPLAQSLPLSPTVVSIPRTEKWRRNEAAIEKLAPIVADADARARRALARYMP